MNIFAVHSNPVIAAQSLCDQHVRKMLVESCQMLSTVYHVLEPDEISWNSVPGRMPWDLPEIRPFLHGVRICKPTHANHPCTVWARAKMLNYYWLVEHAKALAREYTHRFDKQHLSERMVDMFRRNSPAPLRDWAHFSPDPFPECFPAIYKSYSPTDGYRRYYNNEKAGFATWTKRQPPDWFCPVEQTNV